MGLNYGDEQGNLGEGGGARGEIPEVTRKHNNDGNGRGTSAGVSVLQAIAGKKASINTGSELVKAFSDRMLEISSKDVKIAVLDQTKYSGLGYSILAVGKQITDTIWTYGLIALEVTGRQSKSIAEMVAVLSSRSKDAIAGSWQICDIFEPDVKKLANTALKYEIGSDNVELFYAGETYIRTSVPKTDHAAIDAVYAKIVDACTAEGNIICDTRLTLGDFVSDGREIIGKISSGTRYPVDETGVIKRSDARITFVSEDPETENAAYRPNSIGLDAIEFGEAALEFDAVLAKDRDGKILVKPIIIANITGKIPAQETLLLILSTLAGVARPNIWIPLLANSSVEYGHFNRYCNIISDENGNPVSITAEDLRRKDIAHQYIWDTTRDANPMSAPIFALRTSLTEPMQRVFRLGIRSDKAGNAARERILDLASKLTGGIFPETFPKDKIFLGHITAPVGEMNVKKDTKPLSVVDTAYVIGNANNPKIVSKKISSLMFRNPASYIDALQVLNEFAPQAEIHSRETIVYFNPEFIAALAKALSAYRIKDRGISISLVGVEELNATGSNQAYTNTDDFGNWDISSETGFIGGGTSESNRVNPFAVASL